tara:strand:- start:321 stop:953 length:633 start_codon:yes stop_codon:yes gene_type:complete
MKKNILITGSSRGIGEQLAYKFSPYSKLLILCSTSKKDLNKVKLKISNSNVLRFECDLSSKDECFKLIKFCNEKKIDLLINNAAIPCPGIELKNIDINNIYKLLNVNLVAPILLSKFIINLKGIINLNSIVGLEHKKFRSIYSASKWGLRGFSESYKLELSYKILDVYISRVKTSPLFNEGMEANEVAEKILNAYKNDLSKIIIDGRPKN